MHFGDFSAIVALVRFSTQGIGPAQGKLGKRAANVRAGGVFFDVSRRGTAKDLCNA